MSDESKPKLHIEEKDGVIVATFLDSKVLDELNIKQVGDELLALVQGRKKPRMVVDFSRVSYLSSAVLGKLMALHKAVLGQKGKLRLCGIAPSIMEVFEITKLDKIFDIREDREAALEKFK